MASLSRFWAVSGPGGGRTQPRPIATREAARLAVIQHGIVADRADLLGLLLDLLLHLASQPTLNAGLSLNLQVERGR